MHKRDIIIYLIVTLSHLWTPLKPASQIFVFIFECFEKIGEASFFKLTLFKLNRSKLKCASSSLARPSRGPVSRLTSVMFTCCHTETMTSVTDGHIILAPTQPVGSGRWRRESNPWPPDKKSRLYRLSYCSPPLPPAPLPVSTQDLSKRTTSFIQTLWIKNSIQRCNFCVLLFTVSSNHKCATLINFIS